MKSVDKSQSNIFTNKVIDGEIEPPMPNIILNNLTLMGIDSNQNGIRDDVDIWINRTGLDYNERMAMRQYAREEGNRLLACNELNPEKVRLSVNKLSDNTSCINFLTPDKKNEELAWIIISKLIKNNNIRSCEEFFSKFSIVTRSSVNGDGSEKCNFKIEDLDTKKQNYEKWRKTQ